MNFYQKAARKILSFLKKQPFYFENFNDVSFQDLISKSSITRDVAKRRRKQWATTPPINLKTETQIVFLYPKICLLRQFLY